MLPSERGYAQGVTHAGSRLGAAFTPPIVVWLMTQYGWRAPFLHLRLRGRFVGGSLVLVLPRHAQRAPRASTQAELQLIHSHIGERSRTSTAIPWKAIFSSRTLWLMSVMYFCYSYCLATYLEWFPTYLTNHRGYSLKQMGFYASLPLLAGTVGDLAGGWISDAWFKRTENVVMARRVIGMAGFLISGGPPSFPLP